MIEINRIHNMDCLEGLKLIPDKSVDCIITDPPYNINLVPQRGLTDSIANDDYEKEIEFIAWLVPIVKQMERVLKDDSFMVVFAGWYSIPQFRRIFDEYFTLKSMPIWVKNNFGIGYYTRPQYEPCLLYLKGNPKPLLRPISDVWNFKKVQAPIHSCQKPVELMRHIIHNFSKEGDLVLDPFMGSGSTAVACQQLGRRFVGFEISPKYVKIAEQRLAQKVLAL